MIYSTQGKSTHIRLTKANAPFKVFRRLDRLCAKMPNVPLHIIVPNVASREAPMGAESRATPPSSLRRWSSGDRVFASSGYSFLRCTEPPSPPQRRDSISEESQGVKSAEDVIKITEPSKLPSRSSHVAPRTKVTEVETGGLSLLCFYP